MVAVLSGCVFCILCIHFFAWFGVVLCFCVCGIWFVFGCIDSNPTCLHTNIASLEKDVLASTGKLLGVIEVFMNVPKMSDSKQF